MRFAFLILCALTACDHLTVAPKPVESHAVAFDLNAQNAGVIDADQTGVLVTSGWIEKYKALEAEFKQPLPADKAIVPEGRNYRVPYEVSDHYTDMKSAERGP